ncbi:hypothetical protein [Acinetobacter sp. Marseille-Q1618]|uniref:hypothetical protein n=1 Tax=Acinetobacter sp. Marseille-Q1618 TaxID=2697502 RepID=UPI00156E3F3B|nr:hypothetical protein [Acinetobacter sp. Marseille-Q1618]
MTLYSNDLVLENFEGVEVKIDVTELKGFKFGKELPTSDFMVSGSMYGYVEIETKDGKKTKYPRNGKNDSEMLDHILTFFKFVHKDTNLASSIFDISIP